MINKPIFHCILIFALVCFVSSCLSTNITKFYSKHRQTLDSIQQIYKTESAQRPFSIEFTDRSFKNVSIEIWTDSLKYIYEFATDEPRINDTLLKYKLPAPVIDQLITEMQSIHCTWINNLDYYVNDKKNYLVFMSIWPRTFYTPFTNKKYFVLTYFAQPQYYDSNGILMDSRRLRRIRKINNEVFKRINDKVAYTVSDKFR